jgi:heat shock protein HslJ
MRHLTFAVMLAVVVGACAKPAGGAAGASTASPQSAASTTIADTSWTLTHLGTEPVVVVDKQRAPYLTFKDGRVSGNAGCNRLSSGYTQDGRSLTLTPMALTRMACPTGMDVESKFTAALGKVAGLKRTDNQLDLLDASGATVARLTARPNQ